MVICFVGFRQIFPSPLPVSLHNQQYDPRDLSTSFLNRIYNPIIPMPREERARRRNQTVSDAVNDFAIHRGETSTPW